MFALAVQVARLVLGDAYPDRRLWRLAAFRACPFPARRRAPRCSRPSTPSIGMASLPQRARCSRSPRCRSSSMASVSTKAPACGSAIIADDSGRQSSFCGRRGDRAGRDAQGGRLRSCRHFAKRRRRNAALSINPVARRCEPIGCVVATAPGVQLSPAAPLLPATGGEQLDLRLALNGVSFSRRARRMAASPASCSVRRARTIFSCAQASVPATSSLNITACRSVRPRICSRSRTPSSPARALSLMVERGAATVPIAIIIPDNK